MESQERAVREAGRTQRFHRVKHLALECVIKCRITIYNPQESCQFLSLCERFLRCVSTFTDGRL